MIEVRAVDPELARGALSLAKLRYRGPHGHTIVLDVVDFWRDAPSVVAFRVGPDGPAREVGHPYGRTFAHVGGTTVLYTGHTTVVRIRSGRDVARLAGPLRRGDRIELACDGDIDGLVALLGTDPPSVRPKRTSWHRVKGAVLDVVHELLVRPGPALMAWWGPGHAATDAEVGHARRALAAAATAARLVGDTAARLALTGEWSILEHGPAVTLLSVAAFGRVPGTRRYVPEVVTPEGAEGPPPVPPGRPWSLCSLPFGARGVVAATRTLRLAAGIRRHTAAGAVRLLARRGRRCGPLTLAGEEPPWIVLTPSERPRLFYVPSSEGDVANPLEGRRMVVAPGYDPHEWLRD